MDWVLIFSFINDVLIAFYQIEQSAADKEWRKIQVWKHVTIAGLYQANHEGGAADGIRA